MNYEESIDYLFNAAPLFQNIGAGAYKEGLSNTHALDAHFGHPHRMFPTIHVGGTNGKGSVSHSLAAVLQQAGYRVGLYTSPHLIDFRERIRVNGEMIPKEEVIRFVEEERSFFEPLHPSFFELATAMVFRYFADQKVDIAVIEVGLGGRLDCTNIIQPILSIITNISFDHVQFLGNTLKSIAQEKAGIIKPSTPVIIGEANGHEDVREVFYEKAKECNDLIAFADKAGEVEIVERTAEGRFCYTTRNFGKFTAELSGDCQPANMRTILEAIKVIRRDNFTISNEDLHKALNNVCQLTGLMGRWQTIKDSPKVICDTGHNVGGWEYLSKQLQTTPHHHLHVVMGMVSDKDIHHVLSLMPTDATYYFTQASVQRAMPVDKFASLAETHHLRGRKFLTVADAYEEAIRGALPEDLIFVGGSTFVVADLLKMLQNTT